MNPSVRRACKRCLNPACGRWFRSARNFARQRYCSRQCAADCRPRASRVAAGKKGGTNSGIKRRGESKEAIQRRLEGLTVVEAFLLGRKYRKADVANARRSDYRDGFSSGYEQGYDAAMKELTRRSA